MIRIPIFLIFLVSLISCRNEAKKCIAILTGSVKQISDTADMTNNFYDNTETFPLPFKELTIGGEIANPGKVDCSKR